MWVTGIICLCACAFESTDGAQRPRGVPSWPTWPSRLARQGAERWGLAWELEAHLAVVHSGRGGCLQPPVLGLGVPDVARDGHPTAVYAAALATTCRARVGVSRVDPTARGVVTDGAVHLHGCGGARWGVAARHRRRLSHGCATRGGGAAAAAAGGAAAAAAAATVATRCAHETAHGGAGTPSFLFSYLSWVAGGLPQAGTWSRSACAPCHFLYNSGPFGICRVRRGAASSQVERVPALPRHRRVAPCSTSAPLLLLRAA